MKTELTLKERFESKIFHSPDGCWYWLGSLNDRGYGQFYMNDKIVKAHRASYCLYKGEIGEKFVLHSCDNRCCVNPNHLRLGTNDENMQDMVLRNRVSHGERHHSTIFIENEIRIIREAAYLGYTQASIARYFKCHSSAIHAIVNRKQWSRLI